MPRVAVANRTLLVQAQNLFLDSEDYVQASWSKTNLTAITGQGLRPHSTNLFTACSVTPSVANGIHAIGQGLTGSGVVVGAVCALSIFAKWQQNEEWIILGADGGNTVTWCNV